MFTFKWFSLFPPPTSLKKREVLAPYHSPNNFILLGPINTWSWLINCLLKWRGRRCWSTRSTFKTPRGLNLPINNSWRVVTVLNLFVVICYKPNLLHFSEGDLSILMLQGQLSPIINTKQLQQAFRTQQLGENSYLCENQIWETVLNLL